MTYKAKGKVQKAEEKVKSFQSLVLEFWKTNGRHDLPWRKTTDPYKILVSEMMLQQTQVRRVVPKYHEFLKKYPTVKKLAQAQLIDVLRIWNGLGYNRRAKYLHDAAKQLGLSLNGRFKIVPREYEALRVLPGIGDYTAKAVRVFAFNEPEVLIETNIRTVFFHLLFSFSRGTITPSGRTRLSCVHDKEVGAMAGEIAKGMDPRIWHWALMDYGAYLKKNGVRLNSKSVHYKKQSKFEGSIRQVRGAILKTLAAGGILDTTRHRYSHLFGEAMKALERDGLLSKS